jgi:putative flippase GtrA
MIKNLLKMPIGKQFSTYLLIGLTSTSLNYLIFFCFLYLFNVYYLISSGLGIISGITISYFFNKKYTFGSEERVKKSLPKYIFSNLFVLFFNLFTLKIFVEYLLISALISNIFSLSLGTILNFLLMKVFVFKDNHWAQ